MFLPKTQRKPADLLAFAGGLRIKAGIEVVDVFLIQPFLRKSQGLAEAYKMEITSLQMRHSILMESLVA